MRLHRIVMHLKYASDEPTKNNERVMTAAATVTHNGLALKLALEEIKNNNQVVIAAVTRNVKALL